MSKNYFLRILLLFCTISIAIHGIADERAIEIRNKMWDSASEAFQKTAVPEKWANESAIIIAKMNRFEYKKPALVAELHANRIFHQRIMLNDNNAVNEYAEMSYLTSRGRVLSVFAGFKVIKPDGKEIIIDTNDAVEMEKVENGIRRSYLKLAIPGLEVGDILDYYICEYRVLSLATRIFYFSPVIYNLPQEYPTINQRIEFRVQRRCFISLRSMNGAPELKSEFDEETEEQIYALVDHNREAVKAHKWFYPNRALPTIKFRAAYASGTAVRQNDVFLGEPGEVKNHVTERELANLVSYLITNFYRMPTEMVKHVKKNVDKDASNIEKAIAGYHFRRNEELRYQEIITIADREQLTMNIDHMQDNNIAFLSRYWRFLTKMKIPHDIVVTIPKEISSIDDLLLEPELRYLFRVKDGNRYVYFSDMDVHMFPGEIETELQGADAYVINGLASMQSWVPRRITLPVANKEENVTSGKLEVTINEGFEAVTANVKREVNGYFKQRHQYMLTDYYDYLDEESQRFEMDEEFPFSGKTNKRLTALRDSYMSSRDELKGKLLKYFIENEYDLQISSVDGLSIERTGRFADDPTMIYSFKMEIDDIISKVGLNYIVSVGKLIEKQMKIEEDELERNYDIYMSGPRTYSYDIKVKIPEGYEVQGLENLNVNVTTDQGGFVTTASSNEDYLLIESTKFYNSGLAPKESWPEMVKFLNAATTFTEQKVLLKKKVGT